MRANRVRNLAEGLTQASGVIVETKIELAKEKELVEELSAFKTGAQVVRNSTFAQLQSARKEVRHRGKIGTERWRLFYKNREAWRDAEQAI